MIGNRYNNGKKKDDIIWEDKGCGCCSKEISKEDAKKHAVETLAKLFWFIEDYGLKLEEVEIAANDQLVELKEEWNMDNEAREIDGM